MKEDNKTHETFTGYLLLIIGGVAGIHRFYFGKVESGLIWFCSYILLVLYIKTFFLTPVSILIGTVLGVFLVIDFFRIPQMSKEASKIYRAGKYSYTTSWMLLCFGGFLGLHRFYLGKKVTGILYLLTFGFWGLGIIYDWILINLEIHTLNSSR